MTAFDYSRVHATASRLIARYGQAATLLRKGGATGPEWDPVQLPDTEAEVTLVSEKLAFGLLANGVVQAGDRRELMAADGAEPTPADRIRIGAVEYAIILAEPYAPGGVTLYYDLVLRS